MMEPLIKQVFLARKQAAEFLRDNAIEVSFNDLRDVIEIAKSFGHVAVAHSEEEAESEYSWLAA